MGEWVDVMKLQHEMDRVTIRDEVTHFPCLGYQLVVTISKHYPYTDKLKLHIDEG